MSSIVTSTDSVGMVATLSVMLLLGSGTTSELADSEAELSEATIGWLSIITSGVTEGTT